MVVSGGVCRVKHITADRREAWNMFLYQQPYFALMQSCEWGEFKEKLGWKAFPIAVEQGGRIVAGAQMLIKSLPIGLASVAYVPRGPLGNWLDDEIASHLLGEIHRVAREHKAVYLKIEPPLLDQASVSKILQKYGFRKSSYTNQPRATIILDLTPDLDTILKKMRKKTRQYVRRAVRQGITVRIGSYEDAPAFINLIRATAQRRRFPARVQDYYGQQWRIFAKSDQLSLLMAFRKDQLLAVRTVFYFGDHAAEFQAGSTGKNTHLHSDYLLVWEAIRLAKARGCSTYDLWGIPDDVGNAAKTGKQPRASNRTDGLWGVYRFKSGFSKNVVYYLGAYDYVYSRPLYAMITSKFVNADRMHKISAWMDALREA